MVGNLGTDTDETQPMEAEAGAIEQIIANLPPVDPACKQLQFSEEPQGLKRKAQGLETEEVPQTDPVVPKVVEKKAPPKTKEGEYQPPPLPEKPNSLKQPKKPVEPISPQQQLQSVKESKRSQKNSDEEEQQTKKRAPKAKAKAKAKASAKAKAKAKAKGKAKTTRKSKGKGKGRGGKCRRSTKRASSSQSLPDHEVEADEQADTEVVEEAAVRRKGRGTKAKAKARSTKATKANKVEEIEVSDPQALKKAKLSRKSAAYHKAKLAAVKEGLGEEEVKAKAKAVP